MFWRDPSPIKEYPWEGELIDVNLSFDRVLTLFDVFEDKTLKPAEMYYIGFELFVDDEVAERFGFSERHSFMTAMMRDLLGIDQTESSEEDEELPSFDFQEDSGRIFSSFLFDYNINLYEQQGKLSWDDFLDLIANLSEESQFGQAVMYRNTPIPKKTDYNEDEVKRIKQMKERYEFRSDRMKKKVDTIRGKQQLKKMQAFSNIIKKGGKP